MYIVRARLVKRSTYASSDGLSEALRNSITPHDGIEHFHIADGEAEIKATFFVLQPTLAAAEAATLDVCARAIAQPGEDGNWTITQCMATIVPQAAEMFIRDEDRPNCSGS
jgi:hypothetical protein